MDRLQNAARRTWVVVKREWPLELSGTLLLMVAFLLLTTRLKGLAGGYSEAEALTVAITDTFPSVVDNLLYWPYYVSVWAARFIVDDGFFAARIVSALIGFSAALSMFLIVRRWFGSPLATVGTSVLITGSWFLGLARVGTPEISGIASLLGVYASSLWLINSPRKLLPAMLVLVAGIFAWFIPFLPWLMIAGLLYASLRAKDLLNIIPIWLWVLSGVFGIGIIASIGLGFYSNFDQAAQIFGIPDNIPGPVDMLRNVQESLAALFWYAPSNPNGWLGNLPLLDIFGVVMVVLGVYYLEQIATLRRSQIIFGTVGIISFLLAVNGGVDSTGFTLLLPIMAIFVISGIQQYLKLWLTVFPRNPIAKLLAVGTISILIAVSSIYQLQRYFVAWAQAPETREAYSAKIIE